MSNITHGMNVAGVRDIARQLDTQAEEVQRVVTAVDRLIAQAQTDWLGRDSNEFQQMWNGQYKAALQRLKQELNDLGVKARNSAQGQEDASNQL